MSDLKYWLGFYAVRGSGPAKIQALLGAFGDLEPAWGGRGALWGGGEGSREGDRIGVASGLITVIHLVE